MGIAAAWPPPRYQYNGYQWIVPEKREAIPAPGGAHASGVGRCGRSGQTTRRFICVFVRVPQVASDVLQEALTIFTAVFVAEVTGLEIRTASRSAGSAGLSRQFPLLSMAAAVFSGLALAEVALVVALRQWPRFTQLLGGPLAAVFGLAWFNSALLESRMDIQPAPPKQERPADEPRRRNGTAAALMQLGMSVQMGCLLIAIGFRGAVVLWIAGILALCVAATEVTAGLQRGLRPLELRSVGRCLAGALLFAQGVGSMIRLATEQPAAGGYASLFIAGTLCSVGLEVLLRLRRRQKADRDSLGARTTPDSRNGGPTRSRRAPRF